MTDSKWQLDPHRYFDPDPTQRLLGVTGDVAGFDGERQGEVLLCPLTPDNAGALRAVALRTHLPWLRPQPLGLQTSVGFLERLLATLEMHERVYAETLKAPSSSIYRRLWGGIRRYPVSHTRRK